MFPKHPSVDIVVIFVNIVNMISIILSFLTKVLQNTNNNLHSFVSGTDNKRNPTERRPQKSILKTNKQTMSRTANSDAFDHHNVREGPKDIYEKKSQKQKSH